MLFTLEICIKRDGIIAGVQPDRFPPGNLIAVPVDVDLRFGEAFSIRSRQTGESYPPICVCVKIKTPNSFTIIAVRVEVDPILRTFAVYIKQTDIIKIIRQRLILQKEQRDKHDQYALSIPLHPQTS